MGDRMICNPNKFEATEGFWIRQINDLDIRIVANIFSQFLSLNPACFIPTDPSVSGGLTSQNERRCPDRLASRAPVEPADQLAEMDAKNHDRSRSGAVGATGRAGRHRGLPSSDATAINPAHSSFDQTEDISSQ